MSRTYSTRSPRRSLVWVWLAGVVFGFFLNPFLVLIVGWLR